MHSEVVAEPHDGCTAKSGAIGGLRGETRVERERLLERNGGEGGLLREGLRRRDSKGGERESRGDLVWDFDGFWREQLSGFGRGEEVG